MYNKENIPRIPEFFAGKCVFITGATGFMGKVLLEKLLYSCPKIETIYVLLREKKNKGIEERLNELKNGPVFNRLREELPEALEGKQLIAVAGDCSEPGLGLSEEDKQMLIEKVSVIFHSAATVRFDDPIRKAVKLNTGGTNQMLKLAEEMKNLLVFVHVSTTYCNTDRFEIDEAIYPAMVNWKSMLNMLDYYDDKTLNILTPKLLGKLPNTYSFSKRLSEDMVYDFRHTVPVIIYRPSVVCASLSEPVPGWIDSINGPVGLLLACGKGVIHSILCNKDKVMDFSPVDLAINGMIMAAWKNGVEKTLGIKMEVDEVECKRVIKNDGRREDFDRVYNCATSSIRPVTVGYVGEIARNLIVQLPVNDILWIPMAICTTSTLLHYTAVFLFQILPAILLDTILLIRGEQPKLMKIQRKIFQASTAIYYYLNNEWTFRNKRFITLEKLTRSEDTTIFKTNIWEQDEYEYFKNAIGCARKWILMEPDHTLPAAKRHVYRLYWLDIIAKILVSFLCIHLIFKLSSTYLLT